MSNIIFEHLQIVKRNQTAAINIDCFEDALKQLEIKV